jgi:single-stranded-DNA-specific exonuclease
MQYLLRSCNPDEAQALGRACGIAPVLAQVLLNRGIAEPEIARAYLQPLLSGLTPPHEMADRQAAADRLARAVRAGERITVFGDYDVDGTASAAILAGILEELGGQVSVLVANRFEGGYGFGQTALERVLQTSPSLVVVCDCGSSDHPHLEKARTAGVDVIVVDHHLVPDEPLPVTAYINPHRHDCGFPYKGLATVGLVLLLGAAVRAAMGSKLDLRTWLDLVALGTVADVAPLDGDNRRLVRAGLHLLAAGGGRPGVMALREAARVRGGAAISAGDIAFRLAPRLNAAGRLGDQTLSLSLLRAKTLTEARVLASQMERINQERKSIERGVSEEAIAQVLEVYGPEPTSGIVAAKQGWHRGVVSISASKLAERFAVPSAVIALQDEIGRGSCRAWKGFRLYEALSSCAHLLEAFGGHQAAAGFTIKTSKIEQFREAFSSAVQSILGSGTDASNVPLVDVRLEPGVFDLPSASDLGLLEPLGQRNEAPVFLLPDLHVEESKVVGGAHLKLAMRFGSQKVSAFGYQMGKRGVKVGNSICAMGALRPDTWRGGDSVELWLSEFE